VISEAAPAIVDWGGRGFWEPRSKMTMQHGCHTHLAQGRKEHSKSWGLTHSGASSQAKKGILYAEEGHFTYKFVEKRGSRAPCAPQFPRP